MVDFRRTSWEDANPGFVGAARVGDIFNRILENQKLGIANRYMPGTLQAEMAKKQTEAQYYGPNIESEMNERNKRATLLGEQARLYGPKTQAEIDEINEKIRQGKDPYSKISTYPELFKAQSLYRHYSNKFGENHPITLNAKKDYEIMQNNAKAQGEHNQAMTATAPQRFLSPTGKSLLEAEQTNRGIWPSATTSAAGKPMNPPQNINQPVNTQQASIAANTTPTTGLATNPTTLTEQNKNLPAAQPINPAVQAQATPPEPQRPPVISPENATGLLMSEALKKAGTTAQLNRINFMNIADVSLNKLLEDEPGMLYYTGAEGRARYAADKIAASTGKSSPQFQSYERYKTKATLFASQLRQAYGDSVQEEAAKLLRSLGDPSAWDIDPQTAHEKLKVFTTVFRLEKDAMIQQMMNPMKTFAPIKTMEEMEKIAATGKRDADSGEITKIINGKKYIKKNGKVYIA